MAYFPKQNQVKTELQESTTQVQLDNTHVTTCNFGEFNIAYYRHNTPREKWQADISVFARPFPIQMPVMARAEHNLKVYYVPFRVLSPQWNAFINKTPYVPNQNSNVIIVSEMPFFTTTDMFNFLIDSQISSVSSDPNNWDFHISSSPRLLTPLGRYAVKLLHQLGYDIIMGTKGKEHIDAMGLLAAAKVYLDFYYNSSYLNVNTDALQIESLFKKDDVTAYQLTSTDIINIVKFIQKVFYEQSLVTSAWDNPMAPTNPSLSMGNLYLQDLTLETIPNNPDDLTRSEIVTYNGYSQNGTPNALLANQKVGNGGSGTAATLTQYTIDSLKKMTDYCVRYAMAGVREVDRYLARFGVLLSAEKMKRSIWYGEQKTTMEFGAVYNTSDTSTGSVGEYAGQGIINSDGYEHKHWEIESDEYGIILAVATINPKVNYFQGIDRNNLHHEAESYFSGVFDQLGTQAISQAEILVAEDADTYANLQGDAVIQNVYGWIPRGAEYKIPRDRLTGDFRIKHLRNFMNAWHLFRELNPASFVNGIVHNIDITKMLDSEQYLRIFQNTNEEDGDHFYVIYQINAKAAIHAKPLYESYDMESEGKEIMLNTNGPKQN